MNKNNLTIFSLTLALILFVSCDRIAPSYNHSILLDLSTDTVGNGEAHTSRDVVISDQDKTVIVTVRNNTNATFRYLYYDNRMFDLEELLFREGKLVEIPRGLVARRDDAVREMKPGESFQHRISWGNSSSTRVGPGKYELVLRYDVKPGSAEKLTPMHVEKRVQVRIVSGS